MVITPAAKEEWILCPGDIGGPQLLCCYAPASSPSQDVGSLITPPAFPEEGGTCLLSGYTPLELPKDLQGWAQSALILIENRGSSAYSHVDTFQRLILTHSEILPGLLPIASRKF